MWQTASTAQVVYTSGQLLPPSSHTSSISASRYNFRSASESGPSGVN